MRIESGADHDKVASLNPDWTEFDWCWYWERDARKAYKKAKLPDPGRITNCGDNKCVCKTHIDRSF